MISSVSSAAPCSLVDSLNKQESQVIRENRVRNKGGKEDQRSRDSLTTKACLFWRKES